MQLSSLVRTGTTSKWFATNPRPNPSIEGTSTSGLRPLAAAPHVKRRRHYMEPTDYITEILRIRDQGVKKAGHFDYGANVLPVIQHYVSLKGSDDRKRFQ